MPIDPHIKRLARELSLPEQAELVIQRPKFWTPDFCWLYFERCDDLIFDDPQAGLHAAQVAPELAELTQRMMRTPQPRLHLRGLAVLGSAFRRVDELDQAEDTYKLAFRILQRENVPRWDQANLLFRFATLRTFQHRFEDAGEFADSAVGIYRQAPIEIRQLHLGEALIVRGYVHRRVNEGDLAMTDFGEALSCTQAKLRPRTFYSAVHNLACGMVVGAVLPRTLGNIERYVAQARRFFNKKPRSLPKMKLLWLQGMVMMRFGSIRSGEKALFRVQSGFLRMNNIVEMALVNITLAQHYFRTRRLEELKALAVETHELCQERCKHQHIQHAVSVWKDAVLARTVSTQSFANTWRLLEKCSFKEAVKRPARRRTG